MPRKPSLEQLEAANDETLPVGIPPNADVTVRFKQPVDPNALGRTPGSTYDRELQELAAEEFPDEPPPDPLTEFTNEWRNYIGYPLKIVRLPDPAVRRIPGSTYNRPCFELEQLSDMPFEPVNIVGALQIVNGNSGGVFRIWLTDETGASIPGARLDRIVIADPPKQYGREQRRDYIDGEYRPARTITQPPPQPAQLSPLETRMQALQERLLENALTRLLEPTPTPIPNPANQLNDEDRLTLLLVKEGGLLANVIGKVAALAGAPENATVKQSWQERAIDAAMHIAETNPTIVERVSSTLERIVNRVLPDPRNQQPETYTRRANETPPPPVQQLPPAPPPQTINGLPETSQPEDEDLDADEDTDLMAILEDLFGLLSGIEPLTATDPVFIALQQEYPVKFRVAIHLIATQPLEEIVEWIKDKSPLYEQMLDSPALGPHYRARLTELQILCRTPAPRAQNEPIQNETPATETATETEAQQPDKPTRKRKAPQT